MIQHEIDHLDGILILDRISREARRDAMRALREAREGGGAASGEAAGAAGGGDDPGGDTVEPERAGARDAAPA